jgi:long-subunit fatty acid transport protein
MKRTIITLYFLFITLPAFSSFLENFGASTTSLGLAGQSNLSSPDASTNYYLPAALAYSNTLQIEGASFVNVYNIKPITNIVLENSINTESGDEKIGTINNDFSNLYINAVHLSLPIERVRGSVNISMITPFPYAAQFDSGDPYSPEYALIKARPRRPQGFFNFAYAYNDFIALSLGAHLGAKAESSIFTKAAVNNEGGAILYTYASGSGEVIPKLAPIASLYLNLNNVKVGLYYQGKMDSSLKVDLTADEISTGIIFDSIIETVLYYDPETIKAQISWQASESTALHSSINYYNWKGYQTPKINITQLAVMTGTYDYENLQLRNTITTKLGATYRFNDNFTFNFGASYDQSPIDSDFSGNGNTIHADNYTVALSPSYDFDLFSYRIKTSLGLSYQMLKETNVIKKTGQENGQSGRKIGAPGYKIGGNIYTASLGIGVSI